MKVKIHVDIMFCELNFEIMLFILVSSVLSMQIIIDFYIFLVGYVIGLNPSF